LTSGDIISRCFDGLPGLMGASTLHGLGKLSVLSMVVVSLCVLCTSHKPRSDFSGEESKSLCGIMEDSDGMAI
jgi:hypothetical protein